MPKNFKTSYVPTPISFSDLGRKIGEDITRDADRIIAISKAHRQEMDANHGFSDSLKREMPAGLDNAYRSGLQMAFDVMNESAIAAKQNPSAENIEKHKSTEQQYLLFESRAKEKSIFNRQTLQNGLTQQIPGQDATPDDVRAAWAEFDQPLSYELDEDTGVISLGGMPLMESDALNPEKGLFIIQTVHPSLKFQLDPFVEDLQAKNLFARNTDLYILDDENNLTGEINDVAVYDLVTKEFAAKEGDAQRQAIAVDYYTHLEKGDKPFVTEDLANAYEAYNADIDLLEVDGVRIAQGKLNENGEFIFTTDEIPEGGIKGTRINEAGQEEEVTYNQAQIEKWRDAKKYYYEEGAKKIHDGLIREDKSDGAAEEVIDFGATNAPALTFTEGDDTTASTYGFAPAQGSMKAGYDQGRTYNVDNFTLDNRGSVSKVTLTASETLLQAVTSMQASDDPDVRAVGNLFDGRRAVTLSPADDNFDKIMAQIRNADNGTNSKYNNAQFLDAAAQKIHMHTGGQLDDSWLKRRGWGEAPETVETEIADDGEVWEGSLNLPGREEALEEHNRKIEAEGPFQGLNPDGDPMYGDHDADDTSALLAEGEEEPTAMEDMIPGVVNEEGEFTATQEAIPEIEEDSGRDSTDAQEIIDAAGNAVIDESLQAADIEAEAARIAAEEAAAEAAAAAAAAADDADAQAAADDAAEAARIAEEEAAEAVRIAEKEAARVMREIEEEEAARLAAATNTSSEGERFTSPELSDTQRAAMEGKFQGIVEEAKGDSQMAGLKPTIYSEEINGKLTYFLEWVDSDGNVVSTDYDDEIEY